MKGLKRTPGPSSSSGLGTDIVVDSSEDMMMIAIHCKLQARVGTDNSWLESDHVCSMKTNRCVIKTKKLISWNALPTFTYISPGQNIDIAK